MRNSSWPTDTGGAAGHVLHLTDEASPAPPLQASLHHTPVAATVAPSGADADAAPGMAGKPAASNPQAATDKRTTRRAALVQATATLFWIPQAALLAWAIGGIANGAPAASAFVPAAGVLVLGILRAGLDALGVRLAFQGARAALTAKRAVACDALAARSPIDINRPASGEAAAIIGEQAEAVQTYLARFQPARMKTSIVPLVILACVAPLSWVAALILLVAAPLIPIFMALVGWRAREASEAQLVEMGSMNAFLLDRLRGLATIRTLGAVESTATRLRANAETVRRKTMAVLRIAFLSSAVLELFSALGVALVAVYVGFHLLGELPFGAWGAKLTLTQGLFILLLAPAFFDPLRELSAVWHDKAAGEAALAALDALTGDEDNAPAMPLPGAASLKTGAAGLKTGAASQETSAPSPADASAILPAGPLAVAADRLDFRYPGATAPAFPSGICLDVRAGERVALLGPSGSGKSTLLALLAGLARPAAGTISIGGVQLDDATAVAIRQRIAWIGQQPHIFAGAITANVTLGRDFAGRDSVADAQAALAWANLAELHAERGGAVIGESGAGMSGGEALRMALARAAFNRNAGLVLADEPTAHLDRTTAQAITSGLLDLAHGRTLIVATHDPELAARMDRTIVFMPVDGGGERP